MNLILRENYLNPPPITQAILMARAFFNSSGRTVQQELKSAQAHVASQTIDDLQHHASANDE